MLAADAAQMMELPSASPKGTSVACRDSKNFVHAGILIDQASVRMHPHLLVIFIFRYAL